MVLPDSTVFTLAGTVMSAEPKSTGIESCPSPCLRGVAGHVDGNLTAARHEYENRPSFTVTFVDHSVGKPRAPLVFY